MATESASKVLNRYRMGSDQIRKFLPHRFPFLLIDKILEIHPKGDLDDKVGNSAKVGGRVVALKNVTFNEPYFQGHFPELSIVPGVLLIETMAQAASFALYPYYEDALKSVQDSFQCILVGVDNARFRKPVEPGDTLIADVTVTKCRGKIWAFGCTLKVDGAVVAEADLLANFVLRSEVK